MANRAAFSNIGAVTPCPGGWLVLPARVSGTTLVRDEAVVLPTLRDVVDMRPVFDAATINVPIGLADEPAVPYRACDIAARELLGWPRMVALTPVPSRAALATTSFDDARRMEPWLGPSDWRRFPLIREADEEIQPFHQRTWYSAHPDLSFVSLNGDQPLHSSPYQPEGVAERRALLRERLPGLDDVLDTEPPTGAAPIHLLRAAGLLWTARRAVARAAVRLPDDSLWDSTGKRMELLR